MVMKLHAVTYLVRDYDEAITWFTNKLRFALLEDAPLPDGKRWVRVGPPSDGVTLLLAKAVNDHQRAAIGHAAGGRVAYFLYCEDFRATHQRMVGAGVRFLENPRVEDYGTVAVFEDLYGNKWDLLEPNRRKTAGPPRPSSQPA